MTLERFDSVFAARLNEPKESIVSDTIEQLGARVLPFRHAPAWPPSEAVGALPDEPIIETFLVDEAGGLMALSESVALDAWRPRAEAFVRSVLDACADHTVELEFPAYLTCSVTPVALLEGKPHLDDAQLDPNAGLGLVAINGQHVGPRVATAPIELHGSVNGGALPISEEHLVELGTGDAAAARPDEIAMLAQFGQLHAGPSVSDISNATHRQLLVLRAKTAGRTSQG